MLPGDQGQDLIHTICNACSLVNSRMMEDLLEPFEKQSWRQFPLVKMSRFKIHVAYMCFTLMRHSIFIQYINIYWTEVFCLRLFLCKANFLEVWHQLLWEREIELNRSFVWRHFTVLWKDSPGSKPLLLCPDFCLFFPAIQVGFMLCSLIELYRQKWEWRRLLTMKNSHKNDIGGLIDWLEMLLVWLKNGNWEKKGIT